MIAAAGRALGRRAPWLLAALAIGCGGSSAKGAKAGAGIDVPSRAATAGDRLLRYLPAGADLLIELDLARVRGNPVVGPVVTRWLTAAAAETASDTDTDSETDTATGSVAATVADLARAPLLTADAIVLAAYGVGTETATTATLVVGGPPVPGAVVLAEGVVVVAPPLLSRRAEAATAGAEPSLATDRELLRLRTGAMPERAEGAALRAAGRLDFDARVALASATGAQAAPRALSVWIDVVDDAALVAVIDGPDSKDGGSRLAAALERMRDQLLDVPEVRAVGLGPSLRRATIARDGDRVRVTAVVGPRRLRRAVDRLASAVPADAADAGDRADAARDAPAVPAAPAAPAAATPTAKESPP